MKLKKIIYGLTVTCLLSCSGYTKEDGKVYLRNSNEARIGVNYVEVESADYETFKVINHEFNIDLALDKNYVFIGASILEHADPKTFKHVEEYYWKDKKFVYLLQFGRTDGRIMDADPNTFKVFKDYLWSCDRNNVYYEFDKLAKVIPSFFVPINENWGKDNQYYYFKNLRLDTLDYKSAEIVNSYFMEEPARPSDYIRDKNQVFFQNKLVRDANPLTFVADGAGSFGHDDKYMFLGDSNVGLITKEYNKTYIDKK
jgi:hypothetical protein